MQTVHFEDKKVLLTAFSVAKTSESMALHDYLKNQNCTDITTLFWGGEDIERNIPEDVKKIEISSQADIKDIDKSSYDIVFRHTSVNPQDVADAKKVMTSTQIFFNECQAPIIGVTGTKGKGTTSTLISKMLESAGIKTWLLGNVGKPALNILPDIKASSQDNSVVVYEMSSFQLWDITKSPETAVILMIEPDHLDVHTNFEEYVEAKANITRFQNSDDLVTFHPTNKYSLEVAAVSPAQTKKRFLTPEGAYIKNGNIVIEDHVICAVQEVTLPGEHNLQNICAAITAVWKYTQNTEAIALVAKNFEGLEHRLKFVKEVEGIQYFDDSIATTPGSAIAAINAFENYKVVILGGSSKGADFSELAKKINKSTSIRKILLIGDEAYRIAKYIDKNLYEILENKTMFDIVNYARQYAQAGDAVILSPACASFGMFKNYDDRGNQFIEAVGRL